MEPMKPEVMVRQVADLPTVTSEQTRVFDEIVRNTGRAGQLPSGARAPDRPGWLAVSPERAAACHRAGCAC